MLQSVFDYLRTLGSITLFGFIFFVKIILLCQLQLFTLHFIFNWISWGFANLFLHAFLNNLWFLLKRSFQNTRRYRADAAGIHCTWHTFHSRSKCIYTNLQRIHIFSLFLYFCLPFFSAILSLYSIVKVQPTQIFFVNPIAQHWDCITGIAFFANSLN